jgi:hypothetical protein
MTSSNATKVYAPLFFKVLKRFDQDHLHTKLEVSRLTCLGWGSKADLCGGKQTLKTINSYSNSLLIAIHNIYL